MRYFMMCRILLPLLIGILASNADGSNFCSWSTENLHCHKNQFRCLDGKKCVIRESYCDRENDCDDNSDEEYCITSSCPENYKRCQYSEKCIPMEWICNGYTDCPNGDDEYNCGRITTTSSQDTSTTQKINHALNQIDIWINSQQKNENSTEMWGPNIDKLALIPFFGAHKLFDLEFYKIEMAKELSIQLLSQLSNMKLEEIPSEELASYLNAFLVMCINPRNFYGHNIVHELRNRVDHENYTNPYVLLALCNAGVNITESDKNKLIDTFENKHRLFWTGTQSIVVMALACASKQPGNQMDSEKIREMTMELKQQQYRNGTVVNLPTTALVMQALIATDSESDPDNFDEMKALEELLRNQKLDGSFGDVVNTLLAIPVLKCKSLMDINSNHCHYGSSDETSALVKLSRRKGPKIRVQFSLWIGNEKDLERNLILRVPQNMSLYEFMEIAAEIDSRFKFEYLVKDRKPYPYAVSGTGDNPLSGKFWFLYVIQNEEPKLCNKSPADIIPKDNEHYVMWYRRGPWVG